MPVARVICSSCKKKLGYKTGASFPGIPDKDLVSRGMCDECGKKAYAELAGMVLAGKAKLGSFAHDPTLMSVHDDHRDGLD